MAESLEDTSAACADRNNDANSFLNSQFDVFVHDYREYSEASASACGCTTEGHEDKECSSAASDSAPSKKHIVNVTRRLQKAVFSLESLPDPLPFVDLLKELKGLQAILARSLTSSQSEFAPSNVPLPEYDDVDMQLLLGDDQVAKTTPMLARIEEEKQKAVERLQGLLAQAEILMREASHAKMGI